MSNTHFITIPIKIDDGFSQINGIGKFSSAGIVLEFETKLFGIIKMGVKEKRVPLAEIERIKLNKKWFKTTLEIWVNNFTTLSEIPNKDGRIILHITKEDRPQAEESVILLEKSVNKRKEEMPPPRTPVSSLFEDDEKTNKL